MKLHEYQAKAVLRRYGVPTPRGSVASTPQEAYDVAKSLGGNVVVKAQVHAGGRGKAGGVKVVKSPVEARDVAEQLIGSNLITFQTGSQGAPVHKVLVEETLDVDRELYFSLTTDGATRCIVAIASAAGGMEIEEVAERTPEKVFRTPIDPVIGFQPFQGRRLAYAMELPKNAVRSFADLTQRCHDIYLYNDCSMLEINPLILTKAGDLLALDAKLILDDDALFRHSEMAELYDPSQEDPLELEARAYDIAYVKLDGDVGCMVNGAGLAMATMDTIKAANAIPANFLDVGGGASEEKVKQALSLILNDPRVKRVLVNIFGGILRCDIAANGIVAACQDREDLVPIVVRMLGTNAEEGRNILQKSELPVELATTLSQAASLVGAVGT
jgi:succinyl-CoA synthetase beta subunit